MLRIKQLACQFIVVAYKAIARLLDLGFFPSLLSLPLPSIQLGAVSSPAGPRPESQFGNILRPGNVSGGKL